MSRYISADLVDDDDEGSVIEVSGGEDEDYVGSVYFTRAAAKKFIEYTERCWGKGWQGSVP